MYLYEKMIVRCFDSELDDNDEIGKVSRDTNGIRLVLAGQARKADHCPRTRLCSNDGDRKDRQWSPARCDHDIAEPIVAVECKSA